MKEMSSFDAGSLVLPVDAAPDERRRQDESRAGQHGDDFDAENAGERIHVARPRRRLSRLMDGSTESSLPRYSRETSRAVFSPRRCMFEPFRWCNTYVSVPGGDDRGRLYVCSDCYCEKLLPIYQKCQQVAPLLRVADE